MFLIIHNGKSGRLIALVLSHDQLIPVAMYRAGNFYTYDSPRLIKSIHFITDS